MKVEMQDGQPVIDAGDLGPLLGLEPAVVQEKMRRGEITSRYETGTDEDAGRFRLTFFYAGARLRLTCAEDGTVIHRSKTTVAEK
ncbi:hypothetical protein HTT03_17660 [Sulfitobacter sp. S0837]|uniref:DUF6522 family protein n=1 Tax=Sulfitobacter maritimus TaxID=2741719 RepID=UPI001581BB14|nr:DUF6522 family protein [Sulfitobacter maritimus]NUH67114.1 hypothetical protein [Sulfitobacter maritimus]